MKAPDMQSSIRFILGFVAPYRWRWIGATTALLFTAGITLSLGQGVRLVIDEGFVAGSTEQLNHSVLILMLLAVLMAGGTYARFYLVSWLGERVSADIRRAVFNNVIELSPAYFDDARSGEITSRLTTDTTLLQTIVGSSFSLALRSSISLTGALILLLVSNLKLTLLLLSSVPLVLLPLLIFGRRVRGLSRRSQDSIAEVGSRAGEIIQHIKTVQSYTREEEEKGAFAQDVENAFVIARSRITQRAILTASVIVLIFMSLGAMLWIGGSDVMAGRMTAGELGAFVFYALLAAAAVATIAEVYGDLQRAIGATERLVELMNQEPAFKALPEAVSCRDLPAQLILRDVCFSYPSRPQELALDQVSITIPAGKITALVGPSGAGKSTIFELLQRFYDPESGAIFLGDKDIRQLDPKDLREQFGVVSQHPSLFSASVVHNIAYGKPAADMEEIEAAASAAYAKEFIEQLPEGYHSYLGEQGVRLSGGQQQRIAIARALLKDPRVLLLDEATSALDTQSERQIQLALDTLMANRTTLIIAHRLSTVLHADQIIVLDRGRVVARGSHAELIQSCALYRQLAQREFSDSVDSVPADNILLQGTRRGTWPD